MPTIAIGSLKVVVLVVLVVLEMPRGRSGRAGVRRTVVDVHVARWRRGMVRRLAKE
jgi:hypothetical protein